MKIDDLVQEMKDLKEKEPVLEISDVLRVFNIQTLRDLSNVLRGMKNG